jgi:hypothetical protein
MGVTPHIVVVRRDHDFRIVQTSHDFPFAPPVREEARWLALDWWGNCYYSQFRGALGHFPSTVERGLFHLMLVLPGPVAPDRFVVSLREEEYAPLLYDPFRTAREAFPSLTRRFYEERREGSLENGWTDSLEAIPPAPMTEEEQRLLGLAEMHLGKGRSVVVPSQSDSANGPAEIVRFARQLRPETRRGISICTFTNAGRENLLHFGPAFCAQYSTNTSRNLTDVLGELVPVEEGNPFTPIRRRSN